MQSEVFSPDPASQPQSRRTSFRSAAWGALAFYQLEDEPGQGRQLVVVEDIGPSGLFLGTTTPPPVGAGLQLTIYSQEGPAGNAAVEARAVVRWHRLDQAPIGMGVEIVECEQLGSPGLGAWIESWKKPAVQ
jgi:PilZ domain